MIVDIGRHRIRSWRLSASTEYGDDTASAETPHDVVHQERVDGNGEVVLGDRNDEGAVGETATIDVVMEIDAVADDEKVVGPVECDCDPSLRNQSGVR